MGNLLQDPGWELDGAEWQYSSRAGRDDESPRSGAWNAYVLSLRPPHGFPPVWGPPENGEIWQEVVTVPGGFYQLEIWVRFNTVGSAVELACLNGGAEAEVLQRLESSEMTGDWQLLSGLIRAAGSSLTWIVRSVWTGTIGQMGKWWVDDAVLSPAWPGDDPAGGTLEAFLVNLEAVIGTADPNIGRVFRGKPRWRNPQELSDAAAFQVARGGVLDTYNRVGKRVLRFWLLDAQTDPTPLTNQTTELKHTVTIHGFFQWEQEETQEETLRRAAALLLEKIRQAERTALATGEGYQGFLGAPPMMSTSVQTARIGETEIQGHSVDLVVTFFEEVRT